MPYSFWIMCEKKERKKKSKIKIFMFDFINYKKG